MNYTTTVEGSTATYQCGTGLVPEGVITAVCMENGKWDPDPARTRCRLPGQGMCAIIRAMIISSLSSVFFYTCMVLIKRYDMVSFVTVIL